MASDGVVKSVAKKLKYYFEVKSLEEGFNVSDIHLPVLNYVPRTSMTQKSQEDSSAHHLQQMSSEYGMSRSRKGTEKQQMLANKINRYFLQDGSSLEKKETAVRKKLVNYMNNCHIQEGSRPHSAKPPDAGALHRRKKQIKLSPGRPVLEMAPNKLISRGEVERLVNLATKIICNSNELSGSTRENVKRMRSLQDQPVIQKTLVHGGRRGRRKKSALSRPRSYSPSRSPRHSAGLARKMLPSNSLHNLSSSSSFSSLSASHHSSSSSMSSSSSSISGSYRPSSSKTKSPKFRSLGRQRREKNDKKEKESQHLTDTDEDDRTVRSQGRQKGKQETAGLKSRQPVLDSDSDQKKSRHHAAFSDQLEVEVHEGQDYKVYVHARDNFQASKVGPLQLVLVGENGRTKELNLRRIFEGHKEESFAIPAHLIGRLKKIQFDISRAESKLGQSHLSENTDSTRQQRASGDIKVSADDVRVTGSAPGENIVAENIKETKSEEDETDKKQQMATKIILHSMPSSKVVDEIILDTNITMSKEKGITDREHKKWLEKGREAVKEKNKNEKIHDAIRNRDTDQVKYLLYRFPHMYDLKDKNGWLPLHLIAASDNTDLLRWLALDDVDVNVKTETTGLTAMHVAAMNGHVNAMMVLQNMGSSIFYLTKEKQSALHLAAKSGRLECVKWLVANRASLTEKDASGYTALSLAEKYHHNGCADFLRTCTQELNNPKSAFAKMYERQDNSKGNPMTDDKTGNRKK